MAAPMKIKASLHGDLADIRVLVAHPMETGQRKDAAGNTLPAHFIKHLTVRVGERIVVDSQIGTAVSRNPVFGFKVSGARAGERVVISWTDNHGDSRTDEAAIG